MLGTAITAIHIRFMNKAPTRSVGRAKEGGVTPFSLRIIIIHGRIQLFVGRVPFFHPAFGVWCNRVGGGFVIDGESSRLLRKLVSKGYSVIVCPNDQVQFCFVGILKCNRYFSG